MINPFNIEWSDSRLDLILERPFAYECRYITRVPIIHSPIKVLGIMLHAMFADFWKRRFVSVETFLKTFSGLYWGTVNMEHGPRSFVLKNNPPIEIGFHDRDQMFAYFEMGKHVLKDFYWRSLPYRDDDRYTPISEAEFHVTYRGYHITGHWDVLMITPEGIEIWEYKPWPWDKATMLADRQFTFYHLGCLLKYRQDPIRMKVISYRSDHEQDISLKTLSDFHELWLLIDEANCFVISVLFQRPMPGADRITHFNVEDIERGFFSPILPRGDRCRGCEYHEPCRARERVLKGEIELDRSLQDFFRRVRVEPPPEQLTIGF